MKGLIWLTWRQHRWPILVSAAITAILTTYMLITATQLAHLVTACANATCDRSTLASTPSHATYAMNTLEFLPVLVAVFWGVPLLAREYEQRTLALAWSQDVSRHRWLIGKTAIMTVLVGAMAAILAAASGYLAREFHAFTGASLFEGTAYQAGGWLPLTLSLAWLTFGIAAGAMTRRTMPAIALVAAAWFGSQIALMPRLRPHFMTPVTGALPLTEPGNVMDLTQIGPNGGIYVDAHGTRYTADQLMTTCSDALGAHRAPGVSGGPVITTQTTCEQKLGIIGQLSTYQPASRLGDFHLIDSGINLTLLAVSLLAAWWCVHRTRTTTSA